MQPRLRDLAAQVSEVLYLTGISKSVSDAAVVRLLCDVQSAQEGALPPVEVDCSLRRHPTVGGRVWVRYDTREAAATARAVRRTVACAACMAWRGVRGTTSIVNANNNNAKNNAGEEGEAPGVNTYGT